MRERQIFWSGGIGDIFALEATFTDEQRLNTTCMFWASRAYSSLAPLFSRLPSYKNLTGHVSLWDDFPVGFCFSSLEHAVEMTPYKNKLKGTIEDWSIIKKFNKSITFNYSSFIKYRVANVVKFKLPSEFVIVCPYSTENSKEIQSWRRFHDRDWQWLLNYLHAHNLCGVVLNVGVDFVPEDNKIINLSNETTLGEAVEITKRACGYIGIDTSLSVLAAQLFHEDKIQICTLNKILWQCRKKYYASKENFNFIKPWLGATEEERIEWIRKSEVIFPSTLETDLIIAPVELSIKETRLI